MMFISYFIGGLSLMLLAKSFASAGECNGSSAAAKRVDVCPQTEKEWKVAAENKNCKSYCSSYHYHCVMNTWRNETIEVCAKIRQIVGKNCAEFNFGGSRIQRNENMKCSKCPKFYPSNNSFRYRECYNHHESLPQTTLTQDDTTQSAPLVKSTQNTTMNSFVSTSDKNESFLHQSQHDNQRSINDKNVIIVICFFVVAVVVLILALSAIRKHWKSEMLTKMKRFCRLNKSQEIKRESHEKRAVASMEKLLMSTPKATLKTYSDDTKT
uniref:Uncharacterized protein LOC111101452 isoform X1 n=1 Tax=Crassostrea virginica TaxID=6565 RepID=A0A8B8AI12_CRAVI|nr:uncharacterized protein LOC111101452 isoform X1 [Crassostrea virginica]